MKITPLLNKAVSAAAAGAILFASPGIGACRAMAAVALAPRAAVRPVPAAPAGIGALARPASQTAGLGLSADLGTDQPLLPSVLTPEVRTSPRGAAPTVRFRPRVQGRTARAASEQPRPAPREGSAAETAPKVPRSPLRRGFIPKTASSKVLSLSRAAARLLNTPAPTSAIEQKLRELMDGSAPHGRLDDAAGTDPVVLTAPFKPHSGQDLGLQPGTGLDQGVRTAQGSQIESYSREELSDMLEAASVGPHKLGLGPTVAIIVAGTAAGTLLLPLLPMPHLAAAALGWTATGVLFVFPLLEMRQARKEAREAQADAEGDPEAAEALKADAQTHSLLSLGKALQAPDILLNSGSGVLALNVLGRIALSWGVMLQLYRGGFLRGAKFAAVTAGIGLLLASTAALALRPDLAMWPALSGALVYAGCTFPQLLSGYRDFAGLSSRDPEVLLSSYRKLKKHKFGNHLLLLTGNVLLAVEYASTGLIYNAAACLFAALVTLTLLYYLNRLPFFRKPLEWR